MGHLFPATPSEPGEGAGRCEGRANSWAKWLLKDIHSLSLCMSFFLHYNTVTQILSTSFSWLVFIWGEGFETGSHYVEQASLEFTKSLQDGS